MNHEKEDLPGPLRSKQEVLDDLYADFCGLPMTHARRARLSRMIVMLEDEIADHDPPICSRDRWPCRIPRCAVCPVGSASGGGAHRDVTPEPSEKP